MGYMHRRPREVGEGVPTQTHTDRQTAYTHPVLQPLATLATITPALSTAVYNINAIVAPAMGLVENVHRAAPYNHRSS